MYNLLTCVYWAIKTRFFASFFIYGFFAVICASIWITRDVPISSYGHRSMKKLVI